MLAWTFSPDTAFMLAIAWTALNLLMSNFFITYDEVCMGGVILMSFKEVGTVSCHSSA